MISTFSYEFVSKKMLSLFVTTGFNWISDCLLVNFERNSFMSLK